MKISSFTVLLCVITSVLTGGCGKSARKQEAADSSQHPAALGGDPVQSPAQNPTQTAPQIPVQNPKQVPTQAPQSQQVPTQAPQSQQVPTQAPQSQQAPIQAPVQPAIVTSTSVAVTTVAAPVMGGGNLFVVIGGNGTCRSRRMSADVDGLISADIFDSFNEYVFTQGQVTPADDVIYACYEWQSPEIQYFDLRGRAAMTPLHETKLLDVVLSRALAYRQVVIMGHSAGGWLAMKIAASPFLAALPVRITLITIDAVSRVNCQRLRDDGCREAPSDLSPAEMAQLDMRDEWFNGWQQPGMLLGSAPIPQADVNVEFFTNHVKIPKEPAVWAAITQFFAGRL